jgi:hypothetical protein
MLFTIQKLMWCSFKVIRSEIVLVTMESLRSDDYDTNFRIYLSLGLSAHEHVWGLVTAHTTISASHTHTHWCWSPRDVQ